MTSPSVKILAEAHIDDNGLLFQLLEHPDNQRWLQCLILDMNTASEWYSLKLDNSHSPLTQLKEHIKTLKDCSLPSAEFTVFDPSRTNSFSSRNSNST